MAALLGLTLRMLDTLAGQGKAGGDEGKADDDVAGADDFEDLGDDEDFADGREEAWAAALGKLGAAVRHIVHVRGRVRAEIVTNRPSPPPPSPCAWDAGC